MKVLVIGGGGREHAIAWKMTQDPEVTKVYCAPGNPGMKDIECIDISDHNELANFAKENDIALTMVGPEVPLCEGIVNIFRDKGLDVFGPDKDAAQLEGSKTYANIFMDKYEIPTAASGTFDNEADALTYLEAQGAPIVIKADGLAAGKGVTVADTMEQAVAAVKDCFDGAFGSAGARVVIEECLVGEEASIFAFLDGETIKFVASAQDHKRAYEGDKGPNTGGMGTYSPAPVVDAEMEQFIKDEVLTKFLKGVQAEGLDFRGIVFIGLMIDEDGPKVLEFNVRFGDPETQSVLIRMESSLADALLKTAQGKLAEVDMKFSDDQALCVVMASGGYPASYEKGHEITGIEAAEENGAMVFHAGTSLKDGKLVNTGGRVLGITARAADIVTAREKAYEATKKISWKDAFYRNDIAWRALERLK
ncbi:phosphoribosylamine--glycine ligase [Lentisphaera araneosa HTCC2155]|uniref:Phosphoribosylamine--glycine ligase n=1 Tax=Lentisphaera araneosa HTCC2155 TaxID=313628 RepID=A6DHK1_9BACT|nr:phosphoribosylamine--glycine ligase [Lentisphaera araneosa]EDM29084.1 phosphoribosylamine--glycine ligase [Lentisphaera araneosa HTCC2155]